MDLSTTYLDLRLPHPFMPGASPMAEDLDTVRRLEDGGAAAIVLNSLFEEEITQEQMTTFLSTESHAEGHAEAVSYFAEPAGLTLGPDPYLEQVRRTKAAVAVPVIASLNGVTVGGWTDYAGLIEQAGADALERNVYHLPLDPDEAAAAIEDRTVQIAQAVTRAVRIPVAVKLSPFYTALPHLARRLDQAGVRGLVLFQRVMAAEIDVDELEVRPSHQLSDGCELPQRLRWLAILAAQIRTSFAVTGGIHNIVDAVRAIMTGADAVQMVSALLRRGPQHLNALRQELARWLEEHEYQSLEQLHGSMTIERIPDPAAFARANYMRMLRNA